jgi:hypothetical protein
VYVKWGVPRKENVGSFISSIDKNTNETGGITRSYGLDRYTSLTKNTEPFKQKNNTANGFKTNEPLEVHVRTSEV